MRCSSKPPRYLQLGTFVALLCACGGGDKQDTKEPKTLASPTSPDEIPTTTLKDPDWPTAAAKTEPGASAASSVPTGELRFVEDGKLRVVLKKDGSLVLAFEGDRVAGRLSDDDVFKRSDGVVIKLSKDGYIEIDGEESSYRVGKDGTLRGAKIDRIGIAADGTVTGQSEKARPLRVEGASSPVLKRRALYVLALLLLR